MRAVAASLSPEDFRHEAAPTKAGQIQISQVDHPFQVRAIAEMHVPCACGRPLVGLETEIIVDPKGYAIWFTGVCLSCGVQKGIYMSEPRQSAAAAEAARQAKLAAEVTAMLQQVERLREQNEETAEPALNAAQEVA
jgi:hypothetical protein